MNSQLAKMGMDQDGTMGEKKSNSLVIAQEAYLLMLIYCKFNTKAKSLTMTLQKGQTPIPQTAMQLSDSSTVGRL